MRLVKVEGCVRKLICLILNVLVLGDNVTTSKPSSVPLIVRLQGLIVRGLLAITIR